MLVLAGIVLLPALLPIAATDHSVKLNSTNPNETTMAELDQFSMGHVGVSFAFFFSLVVLLLQIMNLCQVPTQPKQLVALFL